MRGSDCTPLRGKFISKPKIKIEEEQVEEEMSPRKTKKKIKAVMK